MTYQITTVEGSTVRLEFPTRASETYEFDSEEEARGAKAVVEEGLTWVGTPFIDCADVKGPRGGADCAMSLTRWFVDTGRLPWFDPRPYDPRHMLHSTEQHFLNWVKDKLGGIEVEKPRPGDVILWQFGRCFSHGGIFLNSQETLHAYAYAGMVLVTPFKDSLLSFMNYRKCELPRPKVFFKVGRRD